MIDSLPGLPELSSVPRVALANLPTPVERLGRLLPALVPGAAGALPELWVKRDDLTGAALDRQQGAQARVPARRRRRRRAPTRVITCGGVQSNHCRATALAAAGSACAACSSCASTIPAPPPPAEGNVLLDALAGAELRCITPADVRASAARSWPSVARARARRAAPPTSSPRAARTRSAASATSRCVEELRGAAPAPGPAHHRATPSARAAPAPACVLGVALLGLPWRVVGFNVCDDRAYFVRAIARIFEEARGFGLAAAPLAPRASDRNPRRLRRPRLRPVAPRGARASSATPAAPRAWCSTRSTPARPSSASSPSCAATPRPSASASSSCTPAASSASWRGGPSSRTSSGSAHGEAEDPLRLRGLRRGAAALDRALRRLQRVEHHQGAGRLALPRGRAPATAAARRAGRRRAAQPAHHQPRRATTSPRPDASLCASRRSTACSAAASCRARSCSSAASPASASRRCSCRRSTAWRAPARSGALRRRGEESVQQTALRARRLGVRSAAPARARRDAARAHPRRGRRDAAGGARRRLGADDATRRRWSRSPGRSARCARRRAGC